MRKLLGAGIVTGALIAAAVLTCATHAQGPKDKSARPRAREMSIAPGRFPTGPLNAITDVPGVRVGQVTIIAGDNVRTGATAILPHHENLYQSKVAAAVHVFNAFGKLAGSTQVEELGQLETPIVLTNTLSVWHAASALAEWTLTQPGNEQVRSVNPVVGETNDGWLNDIRGFHVKDADVWMALKQAQQPEGAGPVEEGSVGAGAGTVAFGWKGGIGTSSRKVAVREGQSFTVGVVVQTNFGGTLTIGGVPVWRELKPQGERAGMSPASADGSCMIIVATDAPLDARQLKRLAARAVLGMARTGSTGSHGSGDFVIAFSTTNRYAARVSASAPSSAAPSLVREDDLSPLFEAAVEATEEAIYNSILKATSVTGAGGHTAEAIPIEKLREVLRKYGRTPKN